MGGKNDAGEAAGAAAQAQARLAEQLVGESSPLRRGLIADANAFVSGGRDVSSLPEFAAAKSIGEAQFQRARDATIANTPEGGALTSALTGLEGDRARGFTELSGALAGDEVNRAIQMATFGAAQGSSGLGAAANAQAMRAQAEAQSNTGKGQALGTIAGAAITKNPAGAAAGGAAGGASK